MNPNLIVDQGEDKIIKGGESLLFFFLIFNLFTNSATNLYIRRLEYTYTNIIRLDLLLRIN